MKKAWFSAAEIAAESLPGMPASKRGVARMADVAKWHRTELARERSGRGGGLEYHFSVLPAAAQAVLASRYAPANDDGGAGAGRQVQKRTSAAQAAVARGAAAWAWYETQPTALRERAQARLEALLRLQALARRVGRGPAIKTIAEECDTSVQTIHNWLDRVRGVPQSDWLPALVPAPRGGGGREAEVDERFWDAFKADYMRQAEPSVTSAYRRCERIAKREGWDVPSVGCLRRRLRRIPPAVMAAARKGNEAVKAMFPAQERDRTGFHAMQAVNADGHKWDVFVRWPDGKVGRPMMVVFQDLYSNKFLSWRYARSENKDMIRLAFGDMIEAFGIPEMCWLDNGRGFANKQMTGGISNRYRFKFKAEEPDGIMKQFGVEVHWATPYAGQSKPIERGFGDCARDIAKHPAFERAYTGNGPGAKPESYSMEHPVPIEEFMAIVDGELHAHNARIGRRTRVCQGVKSFDQAFAESYACSAIKVASAEQVRMCMLAVENVKVRRGGLVFLHDNRFWHEALLGQRGKLVTARFDPDDIQQELGIYAADGTLICVAQPQDVAGFNDVDAARAHNSARKAWVRAQKDMLAAERAMSLRDLVALQPRAEAPEPLPQPTIIRPMFHGNAALKPAPARDEDADTFDLNFERALRIQREMRAEE